MSDGNSLQRYGRKRVLAAAGLCGFLLGMFVSGLLDTPSSSSGNVLATETVTALDAEPTYSLRLMQAIGILLPLFTGLLRLTMDDRSDLGERIHLYVTLGIVGLVIAGVFAAVGGMAADTAVILKASLLLVLGAFTLIGFAAIVMYREVSVESGGEKQSGGRDEDMSESEGAEPEAEEDSEPDTAPDDSGGVDDGLNDTRADDTSEGKEVETDPLGSDQQL